MSITKLTISKYENCSNLKYLNVIITEGDSNSSKTTFGDWTDATSQYNKKNTEKSSRLVVKIVSGVEFNKINLDSCAREIDADKYLCMNRGLIGNISDNKDHKDSKYFSWNECRPKKYLLNEYITKDHIDINKNNIREDETKITEPEKSDSNQFLSPLEHSLEKVKENNARIMENIHLLNRTLSYTQKNEALNIGSLKSVPSHPCNSCGKCFVYETGLRRHYSMRHAFSEIQPRWQVVWTCVQCFQVWPCQDQATKHAVKCCKSGNPEYIREIKTSSLLQCEFCEKVFTSIPRLLRHFKTHTTSCNYECNSCGSTFISYKTAERHWLMCPWLKVYYSFSLPKLLLCNACDRKFRNYDQLYNHRYKFGHFMAKIHNSEGNSSSIGTLVYQCEICAVWFLSSLLLNAHRTQNHPQTEDSLLPRLEKNLTQDYNIQENEFLID